MRENRPYGSMSGEWRRDTARLLRHRRPKGPGTARPSLNHRATPRLYRRRRPGAIVSVTRLKEERPGGHVPRGVLARFASGLVWQPGHAGITRGRTPPG